MKKKLLLLACLCIGAMAVHTQAASTFNEQFNIPKAGSAPVIDGVFDDSEWENALCRVLSKDSTTPLVGAEKDFPATYLYWMWDENGLYYFADVPDVTAPATVHTAGNGSYNSGDGVQMGIYPDVTQSGNDNNVLYFYSMAVASDGSAVIGEHFIHGTGSAGKDVEGAVIACTQNGTNYTLEAFIPARCWTGSNPPLVFEAGTTFAMTNVLMEQDGGSQSLFIDSSWFDGTSANKYTLTNDPAGKESDVEFAEMLPAGIGEQFLSAGSEREDMTSYSGNIVGLDDSTTGFIMQKDGVVRYDFAVKENGKYMFVIPYTAPAGDNCAINIAVDNRDAAVYVELAEADGVRYALIPWELTAGKHSFYIMAPHGYDGETVKSGFVYGWDLYLAEADGNPGQAAILFVGDANGDALLNLRDAILLSRYFAGYGVTVQEECADLDGSGILTRRDAMILKRYLTGWEGYTVPYTK